MTQEEQVIYNFIEEVMKRRFLQAEEDLKEAGTTGSMRYLAQYHVLLIRLRQAVEHPLLLDPCIKGLSASEIRELKEKLSSIEDRTPVYEQIKGWCETSPGVEAGPREAPLFGDIFEIGLQLDSAISAVSCCRCSGTTDLRTLSCEHGICESCIDRLVKQGTQAVKIETSCATCTTFMARAQRRFDDINAGVDLESAVDELGSESADEDSASGVTKKPGYDANGIQPKSKVRKDGRAWSADLTVMQNGRTVSSAKVAAAMSVLTNTQTDAPDDKTIVFGMFLGTAHIMAQMLDAEGIEYLYYWGSMSKEARAKALKDFHEKPGIKVLLVSMKAGSLGLNLTIANRANIMTLWWNVATELQAWSRVKRHLQTKETYLTSIVVRGSVDERLLELQAKKFAETKDPLDAGRSQKLLSPEERLYLFGFEDKANKPSKESDETDSDNASESDA
ncbi:Uu.00g105490.m01.CDS01 [Anthostomella pinea]|uniref:Uu.00g105490.m01.CDS01 n=1 Tax=Anthostomella pinea TaxID=933095 RepID=A0AAI8V8V2_9PEZI|nr:Uu.00g105490.m01.CDS01 [Anthostomella pinea]